MLMNRTALIALAGFFLWSVFLAAAIFSNPDFLLFRNYLSDLGAAGAPSALYFNAGLFLAASILAAVSFLLYGKAEGGLAKAACGSCMLASVALGCVGLFPEGNKLHFTVSVSFFILAAISVLAYSVAHARKHGAANALVALGITHVSLSAMFAIAEILQWNAPLLETVTVFVFEAWMVSAAFIAGKK